MINMTIEKYIKDFISRRNISAKYQLKVTNIFDSDAYVAEFYYRMERYCPGMAIVIEDFFSDRKSRGNYFPDVIERIEDFTNYKVFNYTKDQANQIANFYNRDVNNQLYDKVVETWIGKEITITPQISRSKAAELIYNDPRFAKVFGRITSDEFADFIDGFRSEDYIGNLEICQLFNDVMESVVNGKPFDKEKTLKYIQLYLRGTLFTSYAMDEMYNYFFGDNAATTPKFSLTPDVLNFI